MKVYTILQFYCMADILTRHRLQGIIAGKLIPLNFSSFPKFMMNISNYLPYLFGIISLTLLPQCAPYPEGVSGGGGYLSGYNKSKPGSQKPPFRGYWDADGVQGSAKIRINRAEQKAYFYKGGTLVGVSPISSGDATHRTPAGRFRVTEKDVDHVSSLYGVIKNRETGEIVVKDADTRKHRPKSHEVFVNAPMYNFLRFNGAIGMHTGHLPGYPASHGCVRLPDHMARHFFENSKLGTPVIVE